MTGDDIVMELLADVEQYRVADNDDQLPILTGDDGETADVSELIWQLHNDGLVGQPDWPGWRLTTRGEERLAAWRGQQVVEQRQADALAGDA